jgi:chromosome segregation ATPase
MNSHFRQLGQSEVLPRYIFAESLFVRRRILEVGAVASTGGRSAQFLIERGARSVVACDADVAAVQEAQKAFSNPSVRYRGPVFDDLDAGEFDVLWVTDLAPFVRAPELLKELVRVLAPSGCLLGGLRNPSGFAISQLMDAESSDAPPTFGQLLDALSPYFPSVDVATQSPVLGYQLAFEGSEGLVVDGSLISHSEAAYYFVIAGQQPFRNLDPSWVQLPAEPLAYTGERVEQYSQRAKDWEERAVKLKQSLEGARTELEVRTELSRRLQEELDGERDSAARLDARLESLERRDGDLAERDELTLRIRELQAELQVAKEQAQEAERRLNESRREMDASLALQSQSAGRLGQVQDQSRRERSRREEIEALLKQAEERASRAAEQTEALGAANAELRIGSERAKMAEERGRARLRESTAELETARENIRRLSEELAASQAAMTQSKLEQTLGKARLEELATAAQAEPQLRQQCEDLERKLAESRIHLEGKEALQADLETARAQVDRLEYEVATAVGGQKAVREQAAAREGELERLRIAAAAKESELERLRAEAAQLAQQASRQEARLSEASIRGADLEASARDASERAYRLQQENDRTLAQLSDQSNAAKDALARAATEEGKLRAGLDWAQTELGRLQQEVQHTSALREQIESLGAETRILAGERSRLTRQVESLESDRARQTEELERWRNSQSGHSQLSEALAERDLKIQALQRRLTAQNAELTALRSSMGRVVPDQVQQIYQRATAELTAVKAELFRRSTSATTPSGLDKADPAPTPQVGEAPDSTEKGNKP